MKTLEQIEDICHGRGGNAQVYRSDILALVDLARDNERLRGRILELVEHATEVQAERDKFSAELNAMTRKWAANLEREAEIIKQRDAALAALENANHLRSALENSIAPLVANRTPDPCAWCEGMGVVNTGIDESPVTQCNRCDGTGLKSGPAL